MFDRMPYNIQITPVDEYHAQYLVRQYIPYQSAVGHQDTANLFSNLLGVPVECNRKTLSFDGESEEPYTMLVGQYSGPRLPEGTSTLPEGAKIVWWLVEF